MENQEATLSFELTVNDVNLILAGLGKLPLEASVSAWAKIKQEAERQIQEKGIEIPQEVTED